MSEVSLKLLLQPISIVCEEFESKGVKGAITVVISPIRVSVIGDRSYAIAWGCSRGQFCESRCRYAKAEEVKV